MCTFALWSPKTDFGTCHDVSIEESNEQFSLFTVQAARLWLLVLSVVRITCDMKVTYGDSLNNALSLC